MKKVSHRTASFAFTLALAAGLALGASTLTGCADENDPKTWVKRLDDPAQRSAAIERLGNFYNDAFSSHGKKADAPEVKSLVDVIVDPLTTTYTKGGLDDKTRKMLIKTLSDIRDPRSGPAFAKVFNEYEAGKTDDDVEQASYAVIGIYKGGGKLDQSVIDAQWNCFSKFAPTKSKTADGKGAHLKATTALHDAMLAVKDPSWGPKATDKLKAPVVLDDQPVNDQLDFWQTTSVQILKELKYAPAAKQLVTVLMTKNKLKIANTAKAALLNIPKDAVPQLSAGLLGTDPDLKALQGDYGPDKGFVVPLVDVLSYTTTNAAKDTILQYIPQLDSDQNRMAVATYLTQFPPDPKVTNAFKDLYGKLPPIAEKGSDDTGRERAQLLQVSGEFGDPSLVPFIIKEATTAKGDLVILAEVGGIQAATKVMQAEQVKGIGDALAALEKQPLAPGEKQGVADLRAAYDLAAGVTNKCTKDVTCYLATLDEPIPSTGSAANWKAIKAAVMAGMLGNDATKKALLEKLPKVTNPGARLAMATAIDRLAPNGDVAAAEALEKIVADDTAKNALEALKGDDAVIKVALRLRARAGQ